MEEGEAHSLAKAIQVSISSKVNGTVAQSGSGNEYSLQWIFGQTLEFLASLDHNCFRILPEKVKPPISEKWRG